MNQAPVPIIPMLASIILACTSVPAWSAKEPVAILPETVKKWSAPYRGWHHHPDHVIPAKPEIKGFEDVKMTDVPTVFQVPGDKKWYMTFIGFDGKGYQSFIAESNDLVTWTSRRLAMGYGPKGGFDHGGVVLGAYLYESYDIKAPRILKKKDGKFWSLYGAYPRQGGYELRPGYEGVAASKDGLSWERAQDEPILSIHQEDCGEWEKSCIYQPQYAHKISLVWNPANETYYLFYNAVGNQGRGIGLITSKPLTH